MNDIDFVLSIVKSNLGLGDERDAELTELIQASAGTKNGVPVYRPYIVTAYYLPMIGIQQRGGLIKADGAEWLKPSDLMNVASHYLSLQEAQDCGTEDIEDCWGIDTVRKRLVCGCSADSGELTTGMMGAMVI